MSMLSDEVLVRIISYADYTTQRINTNLLRVQTKVSRMKIADALSTLSALLPPGKPHDIEAELFAFCGSTLTRQYRTRARTLLANLKTNDVLRERIFDGSLPTWDLVRLNSSELATKDLVEQRTCTFWRREFCLCWTTEQLHS